MVNDEYPALNKIPPEEAARIVSKVHKSNYLAHTIREIEMAILRSLGKNYSIVTYASVAVTTTAKIRFCDRACMIRLPSECEDMDDKRIRLILAHELGHLIFNLDCLKNLEVLENTKPTETEELSAWVFAYNLVLCKSNEHRDSIRHSKQIFTYEGDELKRALISVVRAQNPAIVDGVCKAIGV